MLTLIEMVTFDLVPFICMLGGLCWYLFSNRIPEITEFDSPALEKELPSIEVDLSDLEGIDSIECLLNDLDAFNIEVSGVISIPFSGGIGVIIDSMELYSFDSAAEIEYADTLAQHTTQIPAAVINPCIQPTIGMPGDMISDIEIKAMVVDMLIPDSQRISMEEHFEENFADLSI